MTAPALKAGLAAVALAAAVSACASTPPPLAVLLPPAGPCDTHPVLAEPLALEAPTGNSARRQGTMLDATTPCWANPESGVNSPYVLAQLPETEEPFLLTVSAPNSVLRILALEVRMLSAEGDTLRRFDRDDYLSLGDGYSLQIRPRDGETLILVTADPDLVGATVDSIHMGIHTTTVATAYGASNYSVGADTAYSRQFSYEGGVSFQMLNIP